MTHILTSIVKLDFDLTALLTMEKKRPLTEPMIDPMNFLMWIQLTPPSGNQRCNNDDSGHRLCEEIREVSVQDVRDI